MIALRKPNPAFGMGTFTDLGGTNPCVLSFVREFGDDIVLCVNNLSRFPQPVELDLRAWEGAEPIELLGGAHFPRIGELPYLLTVAGHGFYWLRIPRVPRPDSEPSAMASASPAESLERTRQPESDRSTSSRRNTPVDVLVPEDDTESDPSDPQNEHDLQRLVAGWLPTQRWFAGKGRGGSVGVDLLAGCSTTVVELWLARVDYGEDGIELYHLPLVAYRRAGRLPRPRPARHDRHRARARTGSTTPCTTRRSPRSGSTGIRDEASTARLQFRRYVDAEDIPVGEPSLVATGEQSNTSLMFGDVAIMKVFRRLQPGVNPDIEIGRGLAELGSKHVPPCSAR